MSDDPPVLWQYSFSNYNEKARWALDFKGMRHRRRSVMPGGIRGLWLSRGDRTLPAIDLDGKRIVDSTAIIAALEARQPDPPLYPADPEERRRALELEEFFDEHAGHDMRRVGFWEARQDLPFVLRFMTTDQQRAAAGAGRVGLRAAFPFVWRYMSSRYDFNEGAVVDSRTTIAKALDRIEAEREGRDHLVGDHFTVADLTAAALLYPLVWPPEFPYELPDPPKWEFLEPMWGHPALEWISETWRRHRGASAAV
ncbi:MAG TPA: glutathione S-transferase family protein [Solirubrobacterales bacterium]|nr:glutathione S-transferase family protein [Solirubrobacterales bacterium]